MLSSLLAVSLAGSPALPTEAQLRAQTARFAPTDIRVDLSSLPAAERAALAELVRAAQPLDALFLSQSSPGNPELLLQLAADSSPLGKARLHAFLLNKGPWSRIDSEAPFLPGVGAKPAQGGFYPADTKAEIEKLLAGPDGADKASASSFFTVARHDAAGGLIWLPYSLAYQAELAPVALHLRAAAQATESPALHAFLEARARALETNDYRESDVAWMALDSAIDPTLGPYEVYEDGWFNLKAAFEAFIAVRDSAESQKLQTLSAQLQGLEDTLPIEPRYRNPKLGATAPIVVVNEVFAAGDGNRGVQTAAYDLPNDEQLTREKGTKRVMLKNIQQAKFDQVLTPIAKGVLSPAAQPHVRFEAFFTHILMHELMHGLGPHAVVGGPNAAAGGTVRAALVADYGAIEEAKADISGLWALQQLIDKGALPKPLEGSIYTTFLASAFRTLRFGLTEAHGKGQALQLNYLLDKGGFRVAKGCRFEVDADKIKGAVSDLTHELLTLQAEGDKARADTLLGTLGVVRPDTQCALKRLGAIPVDIEPRFVTAAELLK